jgi:hypothetical protein
MHVPALKRTTPHQFVGLALVLGLAASLALNAAMLTRSDDGATQHAVVHVESIGPEQGRFLEERNARIDAGPSEAARVARVAAWGRFMEDRIANLDAGYSEATRVARLAAWGQFLEERNAKIDASRNAAEQGAARAAMSRLFERMLFLEWSVDTAPDPSLPGVEYFPTDQRYAPTALDRYVVAQ